MTQSGHPKQTETMDDYLARLNLEGNRQVWKSNHPKIDFVVQRVLPLLSPGMKATECGIGDGYLMQRLLDARMVCSGVDISSFLINYHSAQFQGRARILLANIADPSGLDLEAQDAVFCLDVLEHVSEVEYQRAVSNVHRVLRPGGLFVGSVPYRENLDNNKVCCPECHHIFHNIGHRQQFDEQKLEMSLRGMFMLRELGAVRAVSSADQVSAWHRIGSRARTIIKRALQYRRPSDRLEMGDTCYFIAERNA